MSLTAEELRQLDAEIERRDLDLDRWDRIEGKLDHLITLVELALEKHLDG